MVSNIPKQGLNRGFTLIELLVTILISSVVLSSIGLLFGTGLRGTRTASEIATVSQNTEVASALLQIELRQAGYLGQLGASPTAAQTNNYLALLENAPWPFTTAVGTPSFPRVQRIAPGATALLGPVCHAQSAPSGGCIETFSVRAITDAGFQLDYVRYHVRPDENSLPDPNIPTLYRTPTTLASPITCTRPDFVCTFPTLRDPASVVQGIEELMFFQTTNGTNWNPLNGVLADGASLGVYFRVRSLQPELTGAGSGTFTSQLNLPTGVTIPGFPVTDSFRRMERWLDLWLPNS